MAPQDPPREQVEILLPPAPLGALVVCVVLRHIGAGLAPVPADIQANPYACLNVIHEGTVDIPGRGPLPGRFLTGPMTAPVPTRARGPLRSVSIVIQPWLLQPALQHEPAETVNRTVALRAGGGDSPGAVVAAADDLARDGTDPGELWSALRRLLAPRGIPAAPQLGLDLLRLHGVAAAARACGLSERHYRRRFVHHMGLRPGAWARIDRLESVLQSMVAPHAQPQPLSDVALQAGYADQAHMTREVRSLLRQSPRALGQVLGRGQEAAWPLQPARPISSRRPPRR